MSDIDEKNEYAGQHVEKLDKTQHLDTNANDVEVLQVVSENSSYTFSEHSNSSSFSSFSSTRSTLLPSELTRLMEGAEVRLEVSIPPSLRVLTIPSRSEQSPSSSTSLALYPSAALLPTAVRGSPPSPYRSKLRFI